MESREFGRWGSGLYLSKPVDDRKENIDDGIDCIKRSGD